MEQNKTYLLKQRCKNINVLYVEDEEIVRLQTSKLLSIYFDNITLAINGKDALEKVHNTKFDIIFTDINMPVMDGLTMIEHIKKRDKNISVVVFSAYDKTEYLLKSIELQIDGYILKPFKFNQIEEVVERVLNNISKISMNEELINLIDGFKWNIQTSKLHSKDSIIELTKNECNLLKFLSSSKYAVYSTEEIEIEIFDDNYNDNKRVRGLISRFNKKVNSRLVKSIYSQGYTLNLDEK
jgi:YesN/AraC family two-component response regulator